MPINQLYDTWITRIMELRMGNGSPRFERLFGL